MHPLSSRSTRRGFTLIELLVTISIIAILMGMIVPVFSTMRTNARISKTKVGAKNLEIAYRAYLDHYKTWPTPGDEGPIQGQRFDMLLGSDAHNTDRITFYEFDQASVDAGMALDGFADPESPGDRVYHVKFDNYENRVTAPAPDGSTVYRPVIVWAQGPPGNTDEIITSWD